MGYRTRHFEKKVIVYCTLLAILVVLLTSPVYAGVDWITILLVLADTFAVGLVTYIMFDWMAARLLRAKPAGEAGEPRLFRLVEELSYNAGIPMPGIIVLPGPVSRAFVHGVTRGRATVFVSRGLLEALDEEELATVLRHEMEAVDEMGWFPYNMVMLIVSTLAWSARRTISLLSAKDKDIRYRQDEHVTVEKAGVHDVPAAVKLLVAHGMYSVVYLNDLSRLAEEGSPFFLVARYDGKPAGFIIGEIQQGRSGRTGHITKIVVGGQYRRKGIGNSLMRAFDGVLEKAGCNSCYIEVRMDNSNAISLYDKQGFKKETTVNGYYPDGTACQIMVKNFKISLF